MKNMTVKDLFEKLNNGFEVLIFNKHRLYWYGAANNPEETTSGNVWPGDALIIDIDLGFTIEEYSAKQQLMIYVDEEL